MSKRGNKTSGAEGAGEKRTQGAGEQRTEGAGEKEATVAGQNKRAAKKGDGEELMNVTVTMPVEVAGWARVRAAGEGDSLARFLGAVLRDMMNREDSYDTAMMRYLGRGPQELRRDGGEIPRREELR